MNDIHERRYEISEKFWTKIGAASGAIQDLAGPLADYFLWGARSQEEKDAVMELVSLVLGAETALCKFINEWRNR